MNCPHCAATSIRERAKKTKLGYTMFFCPNCRHIFNERTGTPFNYLEFPTDIVLLAVLWRVLYQPNLPAGGVVFFVFGVFFSPVKGGGWGGCVCSLLPPQCMNQAKGQ